MIELYMHQPKLNCEKRKLSSTCIMIKITWKHIELQSLHDHLLNLLKG